MRKLWCIIVALGIIFQLSSCAIHRKFPFICFKKECVLGQMGFYAARESFRRAKINSTVRKHKREVKRNVRQGRRGKKPPYDLEQEKKQSDSLTYLGGFSGICKELKLVFVSNEKDTLVAHYAFDEKDMKEGEKELVKGLIEKRNAANIKQVIIVNCHKRSVLSEHEAFWMDERARKIKKFLEKLGVSPRLVQVEE
jgi:hypothetical protein